MNPGSDDNFSNIDACLPESVEELSALLETTHKALLSGKETDDGGSACAGLQGRLNHLCSVVDYPSEDMTITVQAGMPFGELRKLLETNSQQLPVDVHDEFVSVGELVANDISGPRIFGYGSCRDYVIGIEAVDGTGRVFHAGGRVVKNVAGYDFCRLLTGAQGRFAVLTQLTFKLKPVRPEQRILTLRCDDWDQADSVLEVLNHSSANPVLVDLWNGVQPGAGLSKIALDSAATFEHHRGCFVILGIDGTEAACDWQVETLAAELKHLSAELMPGDSAAFVEYCRSATFPRGMLAVGEGLVAVSTLPSRVVGVCRKLTKNGFSVVARAGTGTVFVAPSVDTGSPATAAAIQQVLSDESNQKAEYRVFSLNADSGEGAGMTQGELELVSRIASRLDPAGLLVPHQDFRDNTAESRDEA